LHTYNINNNQNGIHYKKVVSHTIIGHDWYDDDSDDDNDDWTPQEVEAAVNDFL
jgi:hypothetical protein